MCNITECIEETLGVEDNPKLNLNSTIKNVFPFSEENPKKVVEEPLLRINSSIKQVCEFPITLCRRGSKDIISWLNGFTIHNKKSTSEIIQNLYTQIRSSLFLILMCAVLITIFIEACICVFLLISVLLEPGFLFLFSTFVVVGFIGISILTSKQKNKPKRKVKSKEI